MAFDGFVVIKNFTSSDFRFFNGEIFFNEFLIFDVCTITQRFIGSVQLMIECLLLSRSFVAVKVNMKVETVAFLLLKFCYSINLISRSTNHIVVIFNRISILFDSFSGHFMSKRDSQRKVKMILIECIQVIYRKESPCP